MTNMDCSCEWKDFVSMLSESHSNYNTGLCTFMFRLNMSLKITILAGITQTCNMHLEVTVRILFGLKCPLTRPALPQSILVHQQIS